jgi:hypothetical protein
MYYSGAGGNLLTTDPIFMGKCIPRFNYTADKFLLCPSLSNLMTIYFKYRQCSGVVQVRALKLSNSEEHGSQPSQPAGM